MLQYFYIKQNADLIKSFYAFGVFKDASELQDISPGFTIEDIHKIREYNYEMTKNMTRQEKMDYYNGRGEKSATYVARNKK